MVHTEMQPQTFQTKTKSAAFPKVSVVDGWNGGVMLNARQNRRICLKNGKHTSVNVVWESRRLCGGLGWFLCEWGSSWGCWPSGTRGGLETRLWITNSTKRLNIFSVESFWSLRSIPAALMNLFRRSSVHPLLLRGIRLQFVLLIFAHYFKGMVCAKTEDLCVLEWLEMLER